MPDLDDFHNQGAACHGIDQAVIAGTNPPRVIGARQFDGAVREWIKGKDSLREDEFLENIPYRETRNYVIRVLSSAGVYRLLYGLPS